MNPIRTSIHYALWIMLLLATSSCFAQSNCQQAKTEDLLSYIPQNEKGRVILEAEKIINEESISPKEKWDLTLFCINSQDSHLQSIGLYLLNEYQKNKNAEAEFLIGELYYNGLIVTHSIDNCIKWTEQAMKHGSVYSYSRLGFFYREGLGVPQDLEKALYYFELGAAKGDGEALYNLANVYHERGNTDKAIIYYERSIEANNSNPIFALYNLGVIYFDSDSSKSYEYFDKIIKLSQNEPGLFIQWKDILPKTQNYYAIFYDRGLPPVKKDIPKAMLYYQKAAENGHVKAAIRLEELKYPKAK